MTTRGPIFHKIPARFAAQVDYVVNLNLILHFPNPKQPFVQTDWPRTTDLPKLKAVGEPIGRVNPVLTPNPTRPWAQYDWPRTTDLPKLKAVGEPIGRVMPLLTPNPTHPFHQDLWEGERPLPKNPGEPYGIINTLLTPNPAQPFRQNLWENERPLPKAIGEAIGGDAPLLTPNPARPFAQVDWPSIRSTVRAKVDDFVNLLPYQVIVAVSPPFQQNLWDNAARTLPKSTSEVTGGNAPLLTPNPPAPFTQADWPSVAAAQRPAIIDTSAQAILIVTAAFQQTEWFQATPPRWKASVDDVVKNAPLLTPNPSQPFSQYDWPPIKPLAKAVGEAVGGNAPLLTPNPPQPFSQSIWDNVTLAKAKEYSDSAAAISALYSPNPAQPFVLSDWARTVLTQRAKVDDFVNLVPLQAIVVAGPPPFAENDWPSALAARQKITDTSIEPSLALYYPGQPFAQSDWPSPYSYTKSDRGVSFGLNPNFPPPIPVVSSVVHNLPFIVTVGKLKAF